MDPWDPFGTSGKEAQQSILLIKLWSGSSPELSIGSNPIKNRGCGSLLPES